MADATSATAADPPASKTAGVRDDVKRRMDAAVDAHTAAWQAYLQPNGALRNKLSIEDAAELERAERRRVAARAVQIETGAAGPFAHTPAGYKALHRHLFQDVYEWAGQARTVNMHRQDKREDGTDRTSTYLAARFIDQGLQTSFDQLKPALPRRLPFAPDTSNRSR